MNQNAEVIGGLLGIVADALCPPLWLVLLTFVILSSVIALAVYGLLHLVGVLP